ncbi:MAG: response regulator [Acidobacteriota bacterium]
MEPHDTNVNLTGSGSGEDPELAMRDARQRFIAAFPKRSDSIGFLLGMVATLGDAGPVEPLRQIVHRTAGLAGTLGFPSVSKYAADLETQLGAIGAGTFDSEHATRTFDLLQEAFADDLANPPSWAITMPASEEIYRVLVVEDDEDQREVVGIHLRAAGFAPVPVSTGDAALAAARQHRPHLILLDANLPGMDGYAVCRTLKADPELAGTPVVFMTVRSHIDDKAVGLMLGADDYLTKPVDMTELVLRIQILLKRKADREGMPPPAPIMPPAPIDAPRELDYESFVTVAREQLRRSAAVLALVRAPEARLYQTFAALQSESRRRDLVAAYDGSHIVLLIGEMSLSTATERLSAIIEQLDPGEPPRFQIGLASSTEPGAKRLEALLAEADQAIVMARQRGLLLAVAGEGAPTTVGAHVAKGKVVVADDDPEVTRLIDAQLRAAGYQTTLTSDGSQAIAAIEQHHPDIVIVDMMMPRMTGFDVLMKLRHQPGRPRIVVLSARGREQDVTRAFALGADDYVTKPFSPHELLARIERLLR